MNAGAAIAALRALGQDDAACEAAVTNAYWPARMEKLTAGPLVELAGKAELWLDGGHNPAAGRALAATLRAQPKRPTHLICGMLNTKDIGGYLSPLADVSETLTAVSIPDEINTIPAEKTALYAREVGMTADVADTVQTAIKAITAKDPNARILICGSLYLAGHVMRENGA
jgi:dihydrofolate synthase/folylpolyglutamate synthase